MPQNLLKDYKLVLVDSGDAAGVTEVDSSIVDTAGFDGIAFIAIIGTVVATGQVELQAQGAIDNVAGDMALIGAQTTGAIVGTSDTMLIVDTLFPAGSKNYRYCRAALKRTVANTTVQGIVAILYRGKSLPITLDASVAASIFGVGT